MEENLPNTSKRDKDKINCSKDIFSVAFVQLGVLVSLLLFALDVEIKAYGV